MVKRNIHLAKLQAGYLFPEINKRKQAFLKANPGVQLISLGIGDTTEPLPLIISEKMQQYAAALATSDGYTGYGPEKGQEHLREQIASRLYSSLSIDKDEIFISDGSKCDIGRLQILFGSQSSIAVQDPSYPVYVDTSVMLGQTDLFDPATNRYTGINYLNCTPENNFFPNLSQTAKADIIYFCSPNNPTGAVATYEQLKELVDFAKKNHAIIIYDAAYSPYIQNSDLPRSIYEIDGAKEVAIELGSFSKMSGFTGVRLAWSIVPKELKFQNGESVLDDWSRIHTTFFNGASSIAQIGGYAALTDEGMEGVQQLIKHYMGNVNIMREAFESLGLKSYGGTNAPYLWVHIPEVKSWDAFDNLMTRAHIISTPGSGFGSQGEHFLRFSAFGKRENILKATDRLHSHFSLKI